MLRMNPLGAVLRDEGGNLSLIILVSPPKLDAKRGNEMKRNKAPTQTSGNAEKAVTENHGFGCSFKGM